MTTAVDSIKIADIVAEGMTCGICVRRVEHALRAREAAAPAPVRS